MKNLAIIPARGGSKRIPQKNIKSFNGKAILNYSIAAALESGLFCEVMVSTDSEEIAGIARQAGAVVPFLRSELTAGDYATTEDVLREVLAEYQKRGQEFDYMACIYPTAPFVTAEKLRQGMELLIKRECALVMPVVKFSYPPQRAVIIKGNRLEYKWPEYRNTRSQDLEPYYHDCGQFYCYNIRQFLTVDETARVILPMIMSELEVQDIDNEEDWAIAEIKYKLMVDGK
ncbi:MAG: pseudaminic acid cytidylyltransferase [Syntrophomonadaceae bacterium]